MTQLDVRCFYCGSKAQYVKSFFTDDYNQNCVKGIDFSCQSCAENYQLNFASAPSEAADKKKKMRNYGIAGGVVILVAAAVGWYWRQTGKSPAEFVFNATHEADSIFYTTKKTEAESAQERADDYMDEDKSPAQLFGATQKAALLHSSIFSPEF